jgi:arylformamidase
MKWIHVERGGRLVAFDLDAAVDCTRAIDPRAPQTAAFGLPPPTHQPLALGGGRVLSVADGASVDCGELRVHAHGAGTHVECVGHIVADDVTLLDVPRPALWAATLIDVVPERLGDCGERYLGKCNDDDAVVTSRAIAAALAEVSEGDGDVSWLEAIVICCIGSDHSDRPAFIDFTGRNPPYLTEEAMVLLAATTAQLLVVDLPSLDREDDGGGTTNHHRWWGVAPRGAATVIGSLPGLVASPHRLICELAWFPATLAAGRMLLLLDVAPIAADAAPARVRLIPR